MYAISKELSFQTVNGSLNLHLSFWIIFQNLKKKMILIEVSHLSQLNLVQYQQKNYNYFESLYLFN